MVDKFVTKMVLASQMLNEYYSQEEHPCLHKDIEAKKEQFICTQNDVSQNF